MTEWMTIVSLILTGLVVILIEIIFVPGTTVVGVVGFAFTAVGVGLSFRYFGSTIGWIVTAATFVANAVALVLAFRSDVWKRFSLRSTMDSKVNEGELEAVMPGAEGIALSALRPIGKAELGQKTLEVRTKGNYVEQGTRIRVLYIQSNHIFVEPII